MGIAWVLIFRGENAKDIGILLMLCATGPSSKGKEAKTQKILKKKVWQAAEVRQRPGQILRTRDDPRKGR